MKKLLLKLPLSLRRLLVVFLSCSAGFGITASVLYKTKASFAEYRVTALGFGVFFFAWVFVILGLKKKDAKNPPPVDEHSSSRHSPT